METAGDLFLPRHAAAARRQSTAVSTALVSVLFVLSGACGLAYEVVWSRYLGLFLGNTVLLHTAVLGSFMGGLALGSLLIGRRAHRFASPLKAYGWLELAIAGFALAFPAAARGAEWLVAAASGPFPPGTPGLLAIKTLTAALLLLLPTVMMGATFPLLTAHLERSGGSGERAANWLYFANCAGAVLGVLITGFALIPNLGLSASLLAVALLNAAIGAAAVMAGIGVPAPRAAARAGEAPAAAERRRGEGVILLAIGLSGASAFIYELVWTRLFAVSLGSSTYSFTLMLAAFISGLALGSVAAQAVPGLRKAPATWFAGAEILIGLFIALSLPFYERLPYWFWCWRWLLRPTEESIWLYHTFQYGLTFLVMAVPTFLFGLTFPAAIRAAAGGAEEEGVAPHAASVYGWNTVGTLVGVLAGGCLLIPLLGLRGALQAGAVLNLAIGGLLLARSVPAGRLRPAAAACAGLGLLLVLLTPGWHPVNFTSFRTNVPPPPSWSAYTRVVRERRPVFYREDFGTTVAVVGSRDPDTGRQQLGIVVDGKTDATSVGDMPTQVLLGQIPLVLKPESRDVFIIGLGSGVTAGSVLTHPVERVDCVEISPAVADAARCFAEVNHNALADPRLKVTLDDGKTFLASTRRKYDVIISEPTNPWISGVGNLFSEESFRSTARALKPGGIAAQWFHTYALDDRLVATIIRTFREVFPHAVIFQGNTSDFILVGSLEPLKVNFAAMETRLRRARVRDDLQRIGVTRLACLLGLQTHSGPAVKLLAEGGGLNTDELPLLEHQAPHALYTGATAGRIRGTDCRFRPGSGLAVEAYLARRPLAKEDCAALIDMLADPRMGNPSLRLRLLRAASERWPEEPGFQAALAGSMEQAQRPDEALAHADRAASLGAAGAPAQASRLRGVLRESRVTAFTPAPGG